MSMYLDHFGLREVPFSITPHTEFFFDGANRGSTLDALIYAITHDEGIVKVTGEVGSGKTMLCRMLLEKLPKDVATVYLANPSLSRDEILYALADELAMPQPPERVHMLLRALQAHLIEIYQGGKQVVVLIDEAHAMPPESLEEVRLLSNLESNRHKLLKIVMFGQTELDEMLARTEMRQLRERITHNFGLEPLTQTDISGYLMFRMRAAGYDGPDLFTTGAIHLIADASIGLSRRINILADKALLAAFVDGEKQVGVKQVKTAIKDAQFGSLPSARSSRSAAPPAWLALAAGGAVLGAAVAYWAMSAPTPLGPASAAPTVHAEPAAAAKPAQIEVPTPVSESASTPQPAPTQTADAKAPVWQANATGPIVAAAAAAATSAAEPPLPLQPSSELSTPAPRVASAANPRPLIQRYGTAYVGWIGNAPNRHYFIQLMRTNTPKLDDVERYLEATEQLLDPEQIRLYRSRADGQEWLGVIYGEYPNRDSALAALATLPTPMREAGAYPRTVGMLK